jgi:hypothetical protein
MPAQRATARKLAGRLGRNNDSDVFRADAEVNPRGTPHVANTIAAHLWPNASDATREAEQPRSEKIVLQLALTREATLTGVTIDQTRSRAHI